jgi:hypothetical protein
MKRLMLMVGVLLILAAGCGGGSGGDDNINQPYINPNANAYFPLVNGATMTFAIIKGPDNSNAWHSVEGKRTYKVEKVDLDFSYVPPEIWENPPTSGYHLKLLGLDEQGLIFKDTLMLGTDIGAIPEGVLLLPNPTPSIGDQWVLGGTWGSPISSYWEEYMSIWAIATIAKVEDIIIQGKAYKNVLKIDVSGHMESPWFTGELTGLGSYWLAEGVGLIAMEGNCAGWLTDSARIERES